MLRKLLFSILLLTGTIMQAIAQAPATIYPRIMGYVGVLHPIVTFGDGGAHTNFDGAYVVGLPTGINIWKNAKLGFSCEFVPIVRVADGSSRMNNFLFHPGLLVALGHGFTLANRLAFETSGRYGVTPVLNKIVRKGKDCSYFIAMPIPARFGNDHPSTVGIGFQFGIIF